MTCPRSPWTPVSNKGLTILPLMLAQGSGCPGTTFIQPFLCHHVAGWDVPTAPAHVVCSGHADGRLRDSPAARGQCTKLLSSSLNENQVQLGSGPLHSTTCQCSSSSTQDDSGFVCTAGRPLFSELPMASDTNTEYMWGIMQSAHGKGKQAIPGSTVIFSYHMLSLSSD